jgi:mannose-6-phosphate isomerase-like protein (cupin superfamily)
MAGEPDSAGDSGLVAFEFAYSFTEGGPVEEAREVPGEPERLVPFEIARWQIEPGTSNDLDNHRSHEMWLVRDGAGEMTVDGRVFQISAGDAIMMNSMRPHIVRNTGDRPLMVFSVYWPPEGREAALRRGPSPAAGVPGDADSVDAMAGADLGDGV